MAAIAARPHGRLHVRIQALGLGPREYAAAAARVDRWCRLREAAARCAVLAVGVCAVGLVFLAIGAPPWLAAIVGVGAFAPVIRALRHPSRAGVVVERHSKAA